MSNQCVIEKQKANLSQHHREEERTKEATSSITIEQSKEEQINKIKEERRTCNNSKEERNMATVMELPRSNTTSDHRDVVVNAFVDLSRTLDTKIEKKTRAQTEVSLLEEQRKRKTMDVVKMTPVHNTTNKSIAIHTNSSAQKTHTSNCKKKKSFPKNSKPLPLTLKKNITAKELHSSSSSSSSLTAKPKQALQQQTVPPVPAQPQCFSSSSSSAAARKRSHNDDITSALPVVSSPQPQQQSRKKPRKSSSSNSNNSDKKISTGRWTREEHELFLEGLKKHGREWKKVAEKITTRTSAQIRSHAQKYFTKLAKEQQQHQQSHHHGIGVHHPNHLGLVSHQGHVYGNPSMVIMTSPGASASSGGVHHIVHSDQINSNNTGTPFGMMTSSNQTNLSSSVLSKYLTPILAPHTCTC